MINFGNCKQSQARDPTTLLSASVARIPRDTRRHQAVQVQETQVEIIGTSCSVQQDKKVRWSSQNGNFIIVSSSAVTRTPSRRGRPGASAAGQKFSQATSDISQVTLSWWHYHGILQLLAITLRLLEPTMISRQDNGPKHTLDSAGAVWPVTECCTRWPSLHTIRISECQECAKQESRAICGYCEGLKV